MKRIWRDLPITDPLERRQAPVLLMLLPLMFVTALLRLMFFFTLDQASIGTTLTGLINTIALVSPVIALLLLLRGHFSSAALLAALSILLTVVLALTASGLRRSGMLPLVFALPIVVTGLLLGWRSLALVCTLSCAAVIGIAVLESQRSPLVGYTPSPEYPTNMASIFVVVVFLLLSTLAWFRHNFRHELASRLQAEQALRQSEARFAAAFRASPVAMSITSLRDGRFLDINTSHTRLFSYSREELIGQTADAIGIYAGPAQRAEVVRIMRAQGSLPETELALRTKSGEVREVLCSLETIEIDGEACILGSVFDITARKRTAAALRASEERFRQTFMANPTPKLITRGDTRAIVDANPAFAHMTGYAREELIGQTTDALGLWPESAVITEMRAQLDQAGELTNRAIPIRTRDGSTREVMLSVVPIDLDGAAGFLTVMLDQTERIRAELARARAANRLRVLADASQAFAEAGESYQILLGQVARTTAEMLGEGCSIRLLSDDRRYLPLVALYDVDPEKLALHRVVLGDTLMPADQPSLSMGIVQSQRALIVPVIDREQLRATTQPEFWPLVERLGIHSFLVVPLRIRGQAIGILGLYRHRPEQPPFDDDDLRLAQDLADRAALAIGNARLLMQVRHELAERVRAEDAVRLLNVELEQRVEARTAELTAANRELEAFSYSVSHDLRSPLRAIDGFSRILLEDYIADLPGEAQEYFQLIRGGARQMGQLVDDLLAFSRLGRQPLSMHAVDSAALVRECLAQLREEQADRQIRIRIGDLPACQGDPALLKQVWLNLLANALKYTRVRDEAEVTIDCREVDGEAVYAVRDNGVGFDIRYSDKLFGVFQRLHRAEEYEGTGVGLAIVQRIVQRHGGRVWADAAPGQGATFCFTLGGAAR